MRTQTVCSFLAASVLALPALAGGGGGGGHPQVIHLSLDQTATYTSQACTAPCFCIVFDPPHTGPMTGSVTLTLNHEDPGTSSAFYDVTDVDLQASTDVEPSIRFTGTGTFEIGGDFTLTERLALTLTPSEGGDGQTRVYDSGTQTVDGSGGNTVSVSFALDTSRFGCSRHSMQFDATAVPTCAADLGSAGGVRGSDGVLDNNDFIAFIDAFFNGDAVADMGSAGGLPGADGAFDNNDFIVFIDRFFIGCV